MRWMAGTDVNEESLQLLFLFEKDKIKNLREGSETVSEAYKAIRASCAVTFNGLPVAIFSAERLPRPASAAIVGAT